MRAETRQHNAHADSFAQRLRASREHARMAPEDLATAAGITPKRLASLEMGGSTPPDARQIETMAKAMAVPSLWLMAGDLAGERFRPAWYATGARA